MPSIYILNGYCPFSFSDSSRHHLYASYFMSKGLPVNILTSGSRKEKLAYSHARKIKSKTERYVHVVNTVLRPRLLEWFEYTIRSVFFLLPIVRYEKNTVIYASHVHPLTLLTGFLLKKMFPTKVFYIVEVRDLWPHSFLFKFPRFQSSYFYDLIKSYFRFRILLKLLFKRLFKRNIS